jgi:hypothetical protein
MPASPTPSSAPEPLPSPEPQFHPGDYGKLVAWLESKEKYADDGAFMAYGNVLAALRDGSFRG